MKSSLPSPTPADLERFHRLRELGCVVTRVFLNRYSAPDVHHLLNGGERISHQHTIPLSPWFHRGIPGCLSEAEATRRFGPSRAINPGKFHDRFGTDLELLDMTNQLLEAMKKGRAAA